MPDIEIWRSGRVLLHRLVGRPFYPLTARNGFFNINNSFAVLSCNNLMRRKLRAGADYGGRADRTLMDDLDPHPRIHFSGPSPPGEQMTYRKKSYRERPGAPTSGRLMARRVRRAP